MPERPNPPYEIDREVSPGIFLMTVENGRWSFGPPNFYHIVGSTGGLVVDTGTGSNSELSLFRSGWVERGNPKIEGIAVTHHHFDHSGGSKYIAELTGAKIIGGNKVGEKRQEVHLGDRTIIIFPTPGHTRDSLCIWDSKTNGVFTGDTIIEDSSVVVSDMTEYCNSLQELKELRPAILFPGHGNPIENAEQKIQAYIAKTHRRERMIERFIQKGLTNSIAISNRMYGNSSSAGAKIVRAHIEKLERDGKVITIDGNLELTS